MVPAVDFAEGSFDTGIGLDQPRELLQVTAQISAAPILRAVTADRGLRIGRRLAEGLHQFHRIECVLSGAAKWRVRTQRVHVLENRCSFLIPELELPGVADSDHLVLATKRARYLIPERNGA